jgi:bifunctional DNA-binding transcriptional regulator/antitoxin component of YhaV-PrlF toxin-antitoxin module
MTTVTLTFKGQLMILRQLRDTLGLAAAARPRASIDRQGRLVLVPSNDEPEDLFRHRPAMQRTISLDDMQQAISAAVNRADP